MARLARERGVVTKPISNLSFYTFKVVLVVVGLGLIYVAVRL